MDLTILAQEILVSNAKYPTENIGKNSEAYRPLGLGYANLGALLMASGLPYDSDGGRACAAAITALMTRPGVRHERPHRRAHGRVRGLRAEPRAVPRRRSASTRTHVDRIDPDAASSGDLLDAARDAWGEALRARDAESATGTRRSRCSRRPARSAS